MKLMNVNGETAGLFSNLAKNTIVFAKYYSPTCPACVAMSEEWENMEKELSRNGVYSGDLIIAQIDPSGMKSLSSTDIYSDVQYVPTIAVLKNGIKKQDYNGERKSDKMIAFLLENDYIIENNGSVTSTSKSMNGGKKTRRTTIRTKNLRKRSKSTHNRSKNNRKRSKNNRKRSRSKSHRRK